MNWNNYQTIEFHVEEGRFKLFLSGSHLRIQDMDASLKYDRMIWNEWYRIDTTSSFSERFASILSKYNTLNQAKDFIESKFLIG